MTTIISGSSPSITFSDSTTQTTAFTTPVSIANGGTGLTSFTANGVVYASSTSALTTGTGLQFDGTNLGLGVTPTTKLDIGANDGTPKTISLRYSSVPAFYSSTFDGAVGLSTISINTYNTSSGSTSWSAFSNTNFGAAAIQLASQNGSGNFIRFLVGTAANTVPVETARFDSSGNLLVGTTSTIYGAKVSILNSGTSQSIEMSSNGASGTNYGIGINYTAQSPNNTGNEFIYLQDSTALRMSVRSNGGIANYTANNVVLSDRREKTNFAPATSYLDKICAIPVQTFNYIDQNMEEDGGLTLGVVAQDVQAVAPELVTEGNWGTKENPKMRFEIYQTDLQYALMKSIQEQQALITQLTTRLTALENK